ncbi:hypothetical protein M8494_08550 [Serratia ureilytica]
MSRMQQPQQWLAARDALFAFWQGGIRHERVKRHLEVEMAQEDYRLWRAAGVAIEQAYRQFGSPLQRLAGMSAPQPCRHIYSLDRRDDYLRHQQAFAAEQPFSPWCVWGGSHSPRHSGTARRGAVGGGGFLAP